LAPNAPPIKGKQGAEAMYRNIFAHCDLYQTISYEEIQVVGDWAIAWGVDSVTLNSKSGGEAVKYKGHGMTILQRQRDGT
jgi:ketosteroid isomerase-like protein